MHLLGAAVLAASLTLLTACTGAPPEGSSAPSQSPQSSPSIRLPSSRSAPTATTKAPAPGPVLQAPPGRQWVGLDDVVVAVPRRWVGVQHCPLRRGDTVLFLDAASPAVGCELLRGRSLLRVAPGLSGAIPLGRRVDLGAEVNGLQVTHSGLACRASSIGPCHLTFTVTGSDAVFQVFYRGQAPGATVRRIFESVTRLPAGQTTVPLIPYGIPVSGAERLLTDAGLVARAPDVNFPHYAIGTEPPEGTVAPVGTVVDITVGDG